MSNSNDHHVDTFKLERDARRLRANWIASLFASRKR